jgi:transcriptional regulator with XRE-family HTH domain
MLDVYTTTRKTFAPRSLAKMHDMANLKPKGTRKFTPFAASIQRIADYKGLNITQWCAQYPGRGIDQSTVARILRGDQDSSLEMVQRVADATGYAPWQLLRDDFDPRREPPMFDAEAMRVAAVFASIKDPAKKRQARAILETFEDSAASTPQDQPTPAHALGR